MSVILLLMLGTSVDQKEANHFLMVFRYSTYGIGPHGPVVFLYGGAVFTVLFSLMFAVISYEPTSDSFFGCIVVAFVVLSMVILNYFHGVSALYTAKHTHAKLLLDTKTCSVPVSQFQQDLTDLIKARKGIENIDSAEDFVFHVKQKYSQVGALTGTRAEIVKELFKQELKKQISNLSGKS